MKPEKVTTSSKPPKVEQEERNGVKRPKAGGGCADVWAWLDAPPKRRSRTPKPKARSVAGTRITSVASSTPAASTAASVGRPKRSDVHYKSIQCPASCGVFCDLLPLAGTRCYPCIDHTISAACASIGCWLPMVCRPTADPLQGVATVAGVAVAACSMQVQNKEDLRLSESPVQFSLLLLQPLHRLHLVPVLIRHIGVQAIELLLALGDELRPVMVFQHCEGFGTSRTP